MKNLPPSSPWSALSLSLSLAFPYALPLSRLSLVPVFWKEKHSVFERSRGCVNNNTSCPLVCLITTTTIPPLIFTFSKTKNKNKKNQYLIRIKDKSIHQKAALQLSNTKLINKHGALLWLLKFCYLSSFSNISWGGDFTFGLQNQNDHT
jgi:hypothetical protein